MKTRIFITTTALMMSFAYAQEVGVKVDKIDTAEDTTISIKKGSSEKNKKKWIISEGEHEVVGDNEVVKKAAEKNWKAACADWKKEFREDNKENKIISIVCGKMNCEKEGVETTCRSQAKYKIKTVGEE